MNFSLFKLAVAKQFERMRKHQLFRTGVEKDDLWTTYLASFPAGSNPIYRVRTEHDCSCCKQFIRIMGNVVAIIDGKMETIWDGFVEDSNYQLVSTAMAEAVRSKPIIDAFLHYERTAGTDKNFEETVTGAKTWTHFFVNIPARFVFKKADIATNLNDYRTAHDVFKRGLEEITFEAINTVLELIAQNSLYRGEEHKFAVTEFKKVSLKASLLPPEEREAFYWVQAMTLPVSVSCFRNTVIGTLLVDLSADVDLETAVKSFEAKVAPTNYKRPTALITKAMINKAKAKIEELGLTSALQRRYATIDDITVNNVLFANRDARKAMKADVFDELASTVPVKTLDKVENITIDKFLTDVLPHIKTLEVMPENRHTSNFVSLVAPADATAGALFKWGNNFSWSYNGDMADSIKERVKKAGGRIEGALCCRLAWDYTDDLDLHMHGPAGEHVYYCVRGHRQQNGGMLDVDANGMDGIRPNPCENIVYADKRYMHDGIYTLSVNNYCRRSSGIGFEVEIEADARTYTMFYDRVMSPGPMINVARIKKENNELIVETLLPTTTTSRKIWNVNTQTFVPVNVLMHSPNHWDGQGVGNRHYFFMLDSCVNEGQARGFYNEFLRADLDQHRKVIEMVGAKLRTNESAKQLSGLGFSSTQRNNLLCRITGSFSRTLNITF